jgi:Spx/MgsR family transcriptional regulator
MFTIYGIKACDSMKKAFALLDEQGLSYQFFDYKKQAPSAELLQQWIEQLGVDVVLNKRGTTWRKLTDEQKAQAETTAGAITLMQEQPSMIKRPIVQGEGVLLCVLDIERYRQVFVG